jgi:hypothetical protein
MVTITGTGFVPGAIVKFGASVSSSVTFVSSTRLSAVVPAASSPGVVQVRVSTNGGSSALSSADMYAYGPPTVTKLTPNAGPTGGGNMVTITGTGFVPGTSVKFGVAPASTVTFVSPTQLKVLAPANAAGAVDLRVSTPAGTSAKTSGDQYIYS